MSASNDQKTPLVKDKNAVSVERKSLLDKTVASSLLSGACAGAVAKSVIAPLDRTKILFQVSQTQFTYKTAANILYKGYKKNGILSWWRGNSATMARVIPYAAVQFTAHEQAKLYLGATKNTALPPQKRFLAGAFAGFVACSCTYPLDLVRARMAIAKEKYSSLRKAFTTIYFEEGITKFYGGYLPTVIGIMPYAGTSFFIYETLKKKYQEKHPGEKLNVVNRLGYGAFAGICGQTFTYPLDIVRRRMQTDGMDGKGYKYTRFRDTVRYVFITEGLVKGLYKGLSINWIKGPIAVGVSFATFDKVEQIIDSLFGVTEPHERKY